MTLRGKSVVLRPIKLPDAPRFVRWLNDPEVAKYLRGRTKKLTLKEEIKWIKNLSKNKKTEKQFAIDAKRGIHIGSAGLHVNPLNNNAVFGIVIGDKRYWDKGHGTEVTKLLVDYGLNRLKLHKIELNVYPFNKRAMRVYKRVGFVVEGVSKDHVRYGGKYYDSIQMALFKK